MAVTCFSSPHVINIKVEKSDSVRKLAARSASTMLKHNHLPLKKPPKLIVRSSFPKKSLPVFENGSEGILCYIDDESGEIICEGRDEGPRFHYYQLPTAPFLPSPRDSEIVSLLHQRLLQIINGGDFSSADAGVIAVQDEVNSNGF